MKTYVQIKRVCLMSGALVAFHIGSGFASGQEIVQFFTVYGFKQSVLGLAIAWACFTITSYFVIERCRKANLNIKGQNGYKLLCTKQTGKLFSVIVPFLLFFTYAVMLSGAGTVLKDFFAIPAIIGRVSMAILVLGTVLMGLNKLVDVVGSLGPVIILFILILGIIGICKSSQPLFFEYDVLSTQMKRASPNFFIAALCYGGFGTLSGISFFTGLSQSVKSKKETILVALIGNSAFIITAAILNFGLSANLALITASQIPSVVLAGSISPFLAKIFIAIMLLGAYTTAVPMLWSVGSILEKEENSTWYRVFCVILSLIAVAIGGLPFDVLLGFIYPAIGVCGIYLIINMAVKELIIKKADKQNQNTM